MKARIKFQKYGAMKFIGHLDVMRYFQKVFRRADIDNEYSKGFSPHQIMSFAAPLGVGLTSDAEYLDVSLLSCDSPERMMERMNAVLTEGFRIIDFKLLKEPEFNTKVVTAMSLVSSADYLVSLKDGYRVCDSIANQEKFEKAFRSFLDKKEIIIGKKTKTSEKEVDIRPMITLAAFSEEEYHKLLDTVLQDAEKALPLQQPESRADVYENGIKVYLQVETGSSANLKPELVMEAFYEDLQIPFNKYAWQVHRLELYTRNAATGKLAALCNLER